MPNENRDWMGVIARAFAVLCLHHANLRDKGFVPQAKLLEGLGLTRQETADLLGTSYASLSELISQQKRKGAKKKRVNAKGKKAKAANKAKSGR